MARILVVDDQVENLVLVRRVLEADGHRVQTAASAEDALRLIEDDDPFDLFLLDVVLPGMDAFDLLKNLRDRREHKETPILFMSGKRVEPGDLEQAFSGGANDYLLKPVEPRELRARVGMLLQLAEAQRAVRETNRRLEELVAERTRALREALEQLERQHDLWRNLFERLPVLLVAADEQGRLLTCNAEARTLVGGAGEGASLAQTPFAPFLDEGLWAGAETVRRTVEVPGEGERTFEARRNPLPPRPDGGRTTVYHLCDVTAQEAVLEEQRRREMAELLSEIEVLKGELHDRFRMSKVVWASQAMAHVARAVDQLRRSQATVLIRGESGTGKELVARAIHFDGPNRDGPFVPVHCGAIPAQLAESEFFGYVKGAFTGAQHDTPGLFVQADGGTLFLDEIGELSLETQGKLLRVLQSGEVRPVGSAACRRVRTRLIAATNKDLWRMAEEGRFRSDLLYRLDVVSIEIPPLRERPEDIAVLADHFLKKHALLAGRSGDFEGISREALEILETYPWPGNVRELENVFVRVMALAPGPLVQARDLPKRILRWRERSRAGEGDEEPVLLLPVKRAAAERQAILDALARTKGNKLAAAKLLGIGKSSLYRKLKRLGIET